MTTYLHLLKTNKIPGLIMLLDFYEVVDSVEWDFIDKTFATFIVGNHFRKLVNVLYND